LIQPLANKPAIAAAQSVAEENQNICVS